MSKGVLENDIEVGNGCYNVKDMHMLLLTVRCCDAITVQYRLRSCCKRYNNIIFVH